MLKLKVRSVNGQVFGFEVATWEVKESGVSLQVLTDNGVKLVWLNKAMISSVEEE